ncbi:MAG: TIGR03364 family FAD-dependent oxidoreductase [Acidimicrobiia bacterium]
MRVVVVGGGILGTMHAWCAHRMGHEVVQLEGDIEARRASVRNFGLVWVSGRAPGEELDLGVRARALWGEVDELVPALNLRPLGSLTLAETDEELAVLQSVCAAPDASHRGVEMFDAAQVHAKNPAIRGLQVKGAMFCARDALVEPREVLPVLRAQLSARGRYVFLGGRRVVDARAGSVRDHLGTSHSGDLVVICPGADHQGLYGELLASAPLGRCRLQMFETAPLGEVFTTAIADGGSLLYYPAFDRPELAALPAPDPVVDRYKLQLLVAPRRHGGLTIGDTHQYDEPFDFALDELPYAHLIDRIESLLGRALPPVVRRWSGTYSQPLNGAAYVRVDPEPGVTVVTGPGGRGMTLSPAIAEATLQMVVR